MLFVAIHEQILQPIKIHPIEMTGGCDEIAIGCCCFGQRSVQSSRDWRRPTQCLWTAATAQTIVAYTPKGGEVKK